MAAVQAAERVDMVVDDQFSQQPSRKITLILSAPGFRFWVGSLLFHFCWLFAVCFSFRQI
ncbi:hypothetical protein GQ607_006859 [Colletotrichum asianum]|uniref:Uncharacterized protein n=1 Tax=Colletotrichum asianum TaxID=702518 RepID=A0A8H3WBX2_9PEZI|nr:hypothetical protein GQ607_006859 [Colletotrichum asianum]